MTPRRTVVISTLIRALLIGAALGASPGLGAPGQAGADGSLLQPTPLILKDGRIANVSVQALSFAPGQSALGEANTQRLGSLSAQLATDCFLTAQVIGHVGATEAGNDTLAAHRLARARADAVQASLIADGLPAKAIASVWDWQFMVREPRATLWVFQLTPGEDCEGKPLDASAPALVAGEPPPAVTPVSETRPAVTPVSEPRPAVTPASEPRPAVTPVIATRAAVAPTSEARVEPAPDRAGDPEPAAPAAPAAVVRAAEAPATAVAVPAGPARAQVQVPTVTQALPAVSPNPVAVASRSDAAPAATPPDGAPVPRQPAAEPAAVGGKPAAPEPPQVVAALPERPAETPQTPAAGDAGEVVITFPSNSSYFPPGVGNQLRALLRQLGDERSYQVVVQASVSGSEKVVGAESPEEAAKYNRWLAERRIDRVRGWLDQNAAGNSLAVKPEYRANDESRQVVIRLVPSA